MSVQFFTVATQSGYEDGLETSDLSNKDFTFASSQRQETKSSEDLRERITVVEPHSLRHSGKKPLGGCKLPLIHEIITAFQSLGHGITKNPESARRVWENYAESSVFGSGIYAAVKAIQGDVDGARKLGIGMGRATASAALTPVTLGGALGSVPVFHELNTAGESLADAMVGDAESAHEKWQGYAESSVFGSGIYAAVKAIQGDIEGATQLGIGMGQATASSVVTIAVTVTTAATVGLTAPLGMGAASTIGGLVGAGTGAGSSALESIIHEQPIETSDLVTSALMGGVSGAIGGTVAARRVGLPKVNKVIGKAITTIPHVRREDTSEA